MVSKRLETVLVTAGLVAGVLGVLGVLALAALMVVAVVELAVLSTVGLPAVTDVLIQAEGVPSPGRVRAGTLD